MIDQRLVPLALEMVDPANFERFAQTFYGALQDREFVPLGGVHDGGAEGFLSGDPLDANLYVDGAASNFLQASKQLTSRKKIRDTVRRLRDYGRDPKVLTYVTSRTVGDLDVEERNLSQELACTIRIRDGKFIEANINSSPVIQGAFQSYLQPSISHLFSPGVADTGERASLHADRTMAVFLRQEVEHRSGRSGLLESVADSLILWALGDTDPEKGIFLDRKAILERIEQTLPSARQFIRGVLDHRLEVLAAKDAPGGRQIRWYRKADNFCLPYETREIVAAENAEDDLLKLKVSCVFEDRLSHSTTDDIESIREKVVQTCHSTLERVFEHQGLRLAQFVSNETQDDELYTDVAALLVNVIEESNLHPEVKDDIRRFSTFVLRGTFYRSTDVERTYLQKLSRTYVLLLLLKNEPKIVEYFRSIASSFNLYVGSDILIRALSENYLREEDQTTVNLLRILKAAGSALILTETALNEVSSHLHAQVLEFENLYQPVERDMKYELIEYVDRLLIRAYFYATLSPVEGCEPPSNWREYIGQFASYGAIRNKRADRELAAFLTRKFGMAYETLVEMKAGVDESEVNELASKIVEMRPHGGRQKQMAELLANNDALQALRVYVRRQQSGEESPGNPFGYQTWWLTQDSKVRRAAAANIQRRGGKQFMMRPEFLLNYIALAPNLDEIRNSYRTIFPSVLGVRLSARLGSGAFEKVIHDAAEVSKVDPARAGAMITAFADKLKGDQSKIYENIWVA